MKNFDVERGECQLTQTNALLLNKSSTCYAAHCLVAVILLYLAVYFPYTKANTSSPNQYVIHVIVAVLAFALIGQAGFTKVNIKAQECAQPRDKRIVWTDNTKLWYRDPMFLILVIFSLLYGLGSISAGKMGENGKINVESLLCFDVSRLLPSVESTTAVIVTRVLSVLPAFAFVYYFVWKVILGGELVKPVQSDMMWWEAPLAATFACVFVPFGLYAIFGSKILGNGSVALTWARRIFTFRPLAFVFLFAAFYVFVWRLQGGLFLSKSEYRKLKKQVARS